MHAAQRIQRRVRRTESGCWQWTGPLNHQGYGHMKINGQMLGAHRAAYIVYVGPIPDGLQLDHTCHDPATCAGGPTCPHRACVNPAHLEPTTPQVNSQRAEPATRTHCPRNHEYTPENTRVRNGKRHCLACHRIHQANYLARKAAS